MSAGGARRGRRDNGLDASEYAVAGDVDPRVGEHLLDVLAAGGIAAYLQPSADLNPVTRTTTVPARPVDRLYVDRSHLRTARDYLTQLADEATPERPRDDEPDIDAEWARIVAGYHDTPTVDRRPWPAAEDVDDEPAGGPSRATVDDTAAPTATDVRRLPYAGDISGISLGRDRSDEPSLLEGLDTFGAHLPDDDNDRYHPPPPPPLPRVSKYAAVGVLAIVLGFVLFLFPWLLPVDRSVVTLLGFTGILAGFVTLIWRLRPGDAEDDPDDGAVV
ncbi:MULTISPECIES: DUF308 domain-containing protein [Micromonospora]|uniref:DUF308 domain-containing protein n=1 Tax=Micromonospora yangpuensis TaxID=683228 RepID=A0A1C6V0G0_9ACTN|nr:DUF308 domain-containing protein [Micromonospora yangpuensis]GGL96897.1 hypothetical protein GCM10012279_12960 [Micromonospora yangpuensis]SCL59782.1 hypothetical protein GA0070617_4195 [Micromonospora yangpuensis]